MHTLMHTLMHSIRDANGTFANVPVLLGSNTDEGVFFIYGLVPPHPAPCACGT